MGNVILRASTRTASPEEHEILELGRPKILVQVVREHFGEFDALWDRREALIFDEDWRLEDLSEHERRACCHLEGLRVGERHTLDLAREALDGEDASAATAAAFAMLALGPVELANELVQRLETAGADVAHGIRIALRHHPLDRVVEEALCQLAAGDRPVARACALDVLAFQRRASEAQVQALLGGEAPGLEALVIEAIGRVGSHWGSDDLLRALESSESELRRAALETAIRLRTGGLIETVRAAASRREAPVPEAIEILGVIGDERDVAALVDSLADEALASSALAALGATGLSAAIPPIIETMSRPELLEEAAAALLRITGAEGLGPDEPVPAPGEMSEEEREFWNEWPPVDPERAREWWRENAVRFGSGVRFQAGLELSAATLGPEFAQLPLRARRDEYLRSRFTAPRETPDLELEATAAIQLAYGLDQQGHGQGSRLARGQAR